jgi:predicted RNase H-like HicB family nuclease
MELTAIISRDGAGYVALCPQLDIAGQGSSVELARDNLKEALALYSDSADSPEIRARERSDLFVTRIEIATKLDWV